MIFSSGADRIDYLDGGDEPSQIKTLHLDVIGCNTIIYQYKELRDSFKVMTFQRFDLRYASNKWVMYSTEMEFESLAWVGGYAGCSSFLPNDD